MSAGSAGLIRAEAGVAEPIPSLRYAILELGLRCNLKCVHCASAAGRPRPGELGLAEWRSVVNDLAALRCRSVDLMGGEVLLSPLLEPVGSALQEAGLPWGILTNGWLLDDARAADLFAWGCRGIGVSLDGARPETHDEIRGRRGSFQRALRAISVIADQDLAPRNRAVLTSVNTRNVGELEAMGEMLAGYLPKGRWQINLCSAEAPRLPEALRLEGAAILDVARFLDRARRARRFGDLIVTGAHDLGYFVDALDLHDHSWAGCSAGIAHLGVQSDGLVKGCLALDARFGVGNVREHSLKEIWEDAQLMRPYREFSVEKLGGRCRTCVWGSLCRGGCTAYATAVAGEQHHHPHCLQALLDPEERAQTTRTVFEAAAGSPYLAPALPEERAAAEIEDHAGDEDEEDEGDEERWEAPLRSACVELTLRCNLRCMHCGSAAGRARANELGLEQFLPVFIDMHRLGGERVVLLGGEPLLHPDWELIVAGARGCNLDVQLITNGLLVTAERAAKLVELGVSHVGVSIDGGRDETHDRIRGAPGSFVKAWTAVQRLQDVGLPVTVITTLNRQNIGELQLLRDALQGRGVVWQLQAANGTGERFRQEAMLLPAELLHTARFIEQTRRELPKAALVVAAGHNIGHYACTVHDYGTRGAWRGCPGGITSIGLCSDGSVKGCLSMSTSEVQGNVCETPLLELWRDPQRFARNRYYTAARLEGGCGACPHGAVCRAGCPEMARTGSGDVWDNPFCLRQAERSLPA